MSWYEIKTLPLRLFRRLIDKAIELDWDDVQTMKAKLGMPCDPLYSKWEESERRKKSNDNT